MSRGKRTSPLNIAPRTSSLWPLVALQSIELSSRVEKLINKKLDLSNKLERLEAIAILQKDLDSHVSVEAKYKYCQTETTKLYKQYEKDIECLEVELKQANGAQESSRSKKLFKNVLRPKYHFVLQNNPAYLKTARKGYMDTMQAVQQAHQYVLACESNTEIVRTVLAEVKALIKK
jgi:hypothetical protein